MRLRSSCLHIGALGTVLVLAFHGCAEAPDSPEEIGAGGALSLITASVEDSFDLTMPQRAVRLSSGDIAYAVDAISGLVMITDSIGLSPRFVGRRGEGPGEYHGVSWLLPWEGGVLVGTLDGRALHFDDSGRYLEQLPISLQVSGYLVQLRGDTIVVAQPFPTVLRFGFPLHVMTLSGDTVASFGAEDRSMEGNAFLLLYRTITRASDTTFWAIHPYTYRTELWSIDGSLLGSAVPSRTWFARDAATRPVHELQDEYRPATRVRSIRQLADGNLLTLIERVKENAPPRPASTGGETAARSSARMEDIEQVLEVINPRTGALVREMVNPGPVYLMGMLSDDLMWGLRGDEDGRERPGVYRLWWP